MKQLVTAALFFVTMASYGQDLPKVKGWSKEPSDFRGVPFGATMAQAKGTLKDLNCFTKDTCRSMLSLGDKVSIVNYWLFEEDKLVWVAWDFGSDDFNFVRDVLLERYGPAAERKTEPVKTRAGVEYTNETFEWLGNSIVITASRYGSEVTESSVYIATREWHERQLKKNEEAKKKAVTSF